MNKAIVCLLLASTASLLLRTTSALNTACFNANGQITQVFCDGRDITGRLINRANVNKCDCIRMDICGNVTVKAKGVKDGGQTRSGIGLCQTASPTPYKNWVCTRGTRNKRWRAQDMKFMRWRSAQKTRTKRCHRVKKLPCKQQMFWNQGPDYAAVDCVLQQCGDECKSCAKTGPGKCDPGMCNFGEGVNSQTQETRCNRKCEVEFLAWGQRTDPTITGNGYIKITDLRSRSVDKIIANLPGYYFALIDLNQCVFWNKTYFPWRGLTWFRFGGSSGQTKVNLLAEDPSVANLMGVELAVGGINTAIRSNFPGYDGSFSPASTVYKFGTGQLQKKVVENNRNCGYSVIITGSQFSPNELELKVLKPGKPNATSPNSFC